MPKIIGGSLVEHREQTRQRLFAALSTLMDDRGFDAISLADIAAAAGVGRTAVYNHFPDKESMLVAFANFEVEQYLATLERSLEGVTDPVERLRTYVRAQAQSRRIYRVSVGPDLRTMLSPATRVRMREHAQMVEAVLRQILADGIASGDFPEQPIDTIVSLVNACLSSRAVLDPGPERAAAIAATETFVLRAVGVADAVPEPAAI